MRSRRPWRKLALRVLPCALAIAGAGTLAAALQVREVRVTGVRRFQVREVETVLRAAVGSPTVSARAGDLRDRVRALPWVKDATVTVSLDGIVSCNVVERTPVAVEVDSGVGRLVDADGRLLALARPSESLLEIDGFASHPEERAEVLSAAPAFSRCWGRALRRVERLGPHDVALHFADTAFPVLADPRDPGALTAARAVLAAWLTAEKLAPLRMDARVAGRVAVLPAPAPEEKS